MLIRPRVILLSLFGLALPHYASAAPVLSSDPRVDPTRFRVTTFATGLFFPSSMQQLSDGSLLVATSVPTSGFYNSSGQLRRLVDANADGVADNAGTVVYSGLPGSLSSVRKAGNLTVVTSAQTGSITLLSDGVTPASAMSLIGTIHFGFPTGPDPEHRTYALATRPTPGVPGSHDVFFNLGSENNFARSTRAVSLTGMLTASVSGDSIYKFTVNGDGSSVGGLERVASGLRNAAGIAFAANGDLYFEDNGIDTPGNRVESLSADELNKISSADIGGAVEDFGYSDRYVQYRTGNIIGTGGIDPLVAFTPLPNPANGVEAEGANEIAFAPANFSGGLNAGVFVGFHGQFNLGGAQNEENALAWADPSTGKYFNFFAPGQAGVGHLDGLLSTTDSLFAADISSTGSMFTNTATGVIYQITAVPEPMVSMLLPTVLLLLRRRRMN